MVKFDIKNKTLYGAIVSEGETVIDIPIEVEVIKKLYISRDVETIIIPSSVKSIELDAFEYASNLSSIVLDDNFNFVVDGKCLFDKNKTTIYLAERDIYKSVVTPASVRYISSFAFAHCTFIKSIKLNQKIEYIGAFAFIECTSLSKINIPTLNDIDLKEATFEGCYSLKEITIPKNVKSFGKCLFYECDGLERINIETNLISVIPNQCFAYCEALLRLDLNDGIYEIQDNSFLGCKSLKEVTIPNTIKIIGSDVFLGSPYVTVFCDSNIMINYCRNHRVVLSNSKIIQ